MPATAPPSQSLPAYRHPSADIRFVGSRRKRVEGEEKLIQVGERLLMADAIERVIRAHRDIDKILALGDECLHPPESAELYFVATGNGASSNFLSNFATSAVVASGLSRV